nr:hypothetical protein GCM10020093_048810 [Planobispora longispora]
MKLDMLQSLYERTGPFASVYLDTGRAVPQGEQRIELRFKGRAEQLEGLTRRPWKRSETCSPT